MSVRKEFALPDLGEGLTESEIVSWQVAPGDRVELNQILGEVETAKALVELPSPFAGVISELFAEPGTTVRVGAPIVAFELDGEAGADEQPAPGAPGERESGAAGAAASGAPGEVAPAGGSASADPSASANSAVSADGRSGPGGANPAQGRQPVLVGYGPPIEGGTRPARRRRAGSGPPAQTGAEPPRVAQDAATRPELPAGAAGTAGAAEGRPSARTAVPAASAVPEAASGEFRPRSTPPVRKLAHDLGVDLSLVTGTGEDGLITRADVESYVTEGAAPAIAQSATAQAAMAQGGRERETRRPIGGVRKRTAEAMVASVSTAPQATEFLTVDVTAAMELLESLRAQSEFRGKRLSILTLAAKAVCIAAARTPEINSRWDGQAGEIVEFGYLNLGIAAATERGLLVPNVKDADRMTLAELADAIAMLVDTARAGRTAPADLIGGTLTITNVGVFGVDSGTPILNPGEAAILALGAVRRRPWEHRGELALRQVMTLSVSFDHRLVDGEQGSRFLVDVGTILSEPGRALSMV